MSAYLIVHVTVKDPAKLQEYAAAAGPIAASHGGEFVTRTKVTDVLAGSHDHQMAVIMRFPNAEAIRRWYGSEDYQALLPLRQEAADMVFIATEEPPQ